jgi:carbon-monoxide dehydrogenase medium subunit
MYSFDYQRPKTLADAQKQFGAGEDASYMAGGQTLLPALKMRLRRPGVVVDLGSVADLKGINVTANAVTIGAMTLHADVAASAEIKRAIPALSTLAGLIGDPQVRNRGTIGGSIANNDPAADYPAAVVGLDAKVHTSKRVIAADDFFTGLFETALEPGELVVKVEFPKPKRASYMKFRNPASRYAIVGVMVAETGGGVRVAVTGAGPCVFRIPAMEQALSKSFTPTAIKGITVPAGDLNGDLHATPEYRAHLIGVMAERAVAAIA